MSSLTEDIGSVNHFQKKRRGNHYRGNLEEFVVNKVKLLTGHVSDEALWGYLDDPIHELDIFKKAENKRNVALQWAQT